MTTSAARRITFAMMARPHAVLVIVALMELTFCVNCHWERWTKALPSLNRPATLSGEGLILRSDGLGYYAWLRSLLIDGDWDFDNEFDQHNAVGDYVPTDRTAIGRRANPWSVGPACFWSLTIVPAHYILEAWQGHGCPWRADGYSLPYQLLVCGSTIFASWIGLICLYGICRQHTDARRAALAAALLTLGTTTVYYNSIEVSMAHALGTAVVGALVWYWSKTYAQAGLGRWFCVGLLVGAAALMRWQLLTLAVLPAAEAILTCRKIHRAAKLWLVAGVVFAACGTLLALVPQLIAWQCVYGRWLPQPIAISHHWLDPVLGQILFRHDRGLFYWTPLAAVAFAGLLLVPRASYATLGRMREPLFILGMAFFLQVYVLASIWGTGVYLGVAYGFRHLTEVQVLLAPGLALLVNRRGCRFLGCLLMIWNLLLVYEYYHGLLPADAGAEFTTMLNNGLHLVGRKHWSFFGLVFAGPVIIWILSSSASWSSRDPAAKRCRPDAV